MRFRQQNQPYVWRAPVLPVFVCPFDYLERLRGTPQEGEESGVAVAEGSIQPTRRFWRDLEVLMEAHTERRSRRMARRKLGS